MLRIFQIIDAVLGLIFVLVLVRSAISELRKQSNSVKNVSSPSSH